MVQGGIFCGKRIYMCVGNNFHSSVCMSCPPEPVGSVGPWPDQNFGRAYFSAGLSLFLWSVGWGSRTTPRLKRSQYVPPCLRARTSSVCRQMQVRAFTANTEL